MARMLGISDATVHRQLKDFQLQISHSFSTVDDNKERKKGTLFKCLVVMAILSTKTSKSYR